MSKKEKLRNEIIGARDDLRYVEYNEGLDSEGVTYFRGVYEGLVMAWKILYGEEPNYESK